MAGDDGPNALRGIEPTRDRRRPSLIRVRLSASTFRVGRRLTAVKRRTLRPGSYRLVVRATDAAGNRSAARTVRFKVVGR